MSDKKSYEEQILNIRNNYVVDRIDELIPRVVRRIPINVLHDAANIARKADKEKAALQARIVELERMVVSLWSALDEIDTADDLAKDNEQLYRNLVRRYHEKRFDVLTSDGYALFDAKTGKLFSDFKGVDYKPFNESPTNPAEAER